ncbi:MAG: hypothetical protein AAF711_19390 [Planctomycetota bacterium]
MNDPRGGVDGQTTGQARLDDAYETPARVGRGGTLTTRPRTPSQAWHT